MSRILGNDDYYAGDPDTDVDYADTVCSTSLLSFLNGATNAKDVCDGYMNAYEGAGCQTDDVSADYSSQASSGDNFQCCRTLRNHYDEYCQNRYNGLISNEVLLLVVTILIASEIAKGLVKQRGIHWLPDAAVCIIVGSLFGFIAHWIPWFSLDDLPFDSGLLVSVLLPPIILEAALSIDKRSFRKNRLAIFMFAIIGTLVSSFLTGFMVYSLSRISSSESLPLLDSVVYGTLISSIDPVAILSVLGTLNVGKTEVIYMLVIGESLLNDGVAITLFRSLVNKYGGDNEIDSSEFFEAMANFLIVGIGSVSIGLVCGLLSLLFYRSLHGVLSPVLEVSSFLLWAFFPYYIADAVEWSGIVAIVTIGFFMDTYVAAPAKQLNEEQEKGNGPEVILDIRKDVYVELAEQKQKKLKRSASDSSSVSSFEAILIDGRLRMSKEADRHVRFVVHLAASLAENSIFVYLGLFLFSSHYDWDPTLLSIGVFSCIICRALMVVLVSFAIYGMSVVSRRIIFSSSACCGDVETPRASKAVETLMQGKTQVVLVLAGLRGAVSLALVEDIPIYNALTGRGTIYKPALKAMTSASIICTVFILGGSSYYLLPMLGIKPQKKSSENNNMASDSYDSPSLKALST